MADTSPEKGRLEALDDRRRNVRIAPRDRRHSAYVSRLRWALPFLVLFIVAMLMIWPKIQMEISERRFAPSKLDKAALEAAATQNKLLSAILQRFESEVIGALVNHTIGPIKERIDQAVEKLLFQEIASATVGGPPPGLKLDTAAIRTHGSTIKNEADANIQGGRSFSNKVSALTFTTG